MRFWTKKELLEHLGKDRKDVRLVDRMVARGEVERVSWGYEYLGSAKRWEADLELKKKYDELEKEYKDLEASYIKWIQEHPATSTTKDKEGVKDSELLWHLEYMYNMVQAKNTFINEVVQQYYNKNSSANDFDDAKDKCYKLFKYEEDPNEKDELEYIKDILTWN